MTKQIDFQGKKHIAIGISVILIVIAAISIFTKGLNFGIDFKGGSLLQIQFPVEKKITEKKIRPILENPEFGLKATQILIQKLYDINGSHNGQFLVNTQELSPDLRKKIVSALKSKIGMSDILREENVGPAIGKELRGQAVKAILASLILILFYIWYRFEFKFAVGAVVALLHDITITLGIFSLFGKEISIPVIAGFLTIIGYSLNDTIVICDRIRENMKLIRKMNFQDLVNKSINQSLTRTINTSLTTFFPVLILWWFGGAVLENFALSLLIGVVIGTYSSIYIVSPIVIGWRNLELAETKK
ncbi:protein translocase subunit SecF [bacterium]|nr:protein translocase subunit SecF [bacterium]